MSSSFEFWTLSSPTQNPHISVRDKRHRSTSNTTAFAVAVSVSPLIRSCLCSRISWIIVSLGQAAHYAVLPFAFVLIPSSFGLRPYSTQNLRISVRDKRHRSTSNTNAFAVAVSLSPLTSFVPLLTDFLDYCFPRTSRSLRAAAIRVCPHTFEFRTSSSLYTKSAKKSYVL